MYKILKSLLANRFWSRDGIVWLKFLLESAFQCLHVYYVPALLRGRLHLLVTISYYFSFIKFSYIVKVNMTSKLRFEPSVLKSTPLSKRALLLVMSEWRFSHEGFGHCFENFDTTVVYHLSIQDVKIKYQIVSMHYLQPIESFSSKHFTLH